MENIYLVGFMGAGKTTVGKLLAQRLDFTFVDIDEIIVSQLNMPITRIFDEEGESFFRAQETETLHDISLNSSQVVATGGGVIESTENINIMKSTGVMIFLDVDWETIQSRISQNNERPLAIPGDNWISTRKLYENRLSQYRLANITLCSSDKSVDQLVADLEDRLLSQ